MTNHFPPNRRHKGNSALDTRASWSNVPTRWTLAVIAMAFLPQSLCAQNPVPVNDVPFVYELTTDSDVATLQRESTSTSSSTMEGLTPSLHEMPPAFGPPASKQTHATPTPVGGELVENSFAGSSQVADSRSAANDASPGSLQTLFPNTPYDAVDEEDNYTLQAQPTPAPAPTYMLQAPDGKEPVVQETGVPAYDQYGNPGIEYGPSLAKPDPSLTLPSVISPWWSRQVSSPLRNTSMPRPVSINGLIAAALQHSAQVQVISDTPLIRDTAIIEADAAFDWRTFMESAWNERNEPVGSTLTTGGPNRFRDTRVDYELGFRRQTGTGGQFEVGQRYGYERSNSVFFVPNDQGTSRLTMSYTQPLLRGAGRPYSTSLIVLAQIDSAIARDDFSRQLQEHLLEVTKAYWSLYLERANLLQRQRLYERGREILDELAHRESIDAVTNQVVRARAAVTARKSELYRAAAAVKNSEGRIRALVNAPELGALDEFELTPMDLPTTELVPVDLRQSLEVAIRKRSEVNVALKQIKGSAVRLNMSKSELLPVLDVVLESYFSGLRGNAGVGSAWADQFSTGGPSYTAGLQFEMPLRNRESRARYQRRALELRQFQNQFRNTIYALQLEVEIAVREVETSYRELAAKYEAMLAAASELDFIRNRWELLPGEDRTASLVLEDMLAAQERLSNVEFDFTNTAVTYNLAITNLKRTMGTLLEFEQVGLDKSDECGIPTITVHKEGEVSHYDQALPLTFGPE